MRLKKHVLRLDQLPLEANRTAVVLGKEAAATSLESPVGEPGGDSMRYCRCKTRPVGYVAWLLSPSGGLLSRGPSHS